MSTKKKLPKKPKNPPAKKTPTRKTTRKSSTKSTAKKPSTSKTKAAGKTTAKQQKPTKKPTVSKKKAATKATVKKTAKVTAKKKTTKRAPAKKKEKIEISAEEVDQVEEQMEELLSAKEVNIHDQYEFKNYFKSEPQLDTVDQNSDLEEILAAYHRIVFVTAKRHMRPGVVELEDLIAQGQLGICDSVDQYLNPERKTPKYRFHMNCLYKIRDHIYKYCIGNANQLDTPVYIQRGLMHVAQIFQLMQNQKVAEEILKRPGAASTEEIIEFLYEEDERLPLKPVSYIKKQINRKVSKKEFEQIFNGVMQHKRGSQHSYVKNNLTDAGKILHIKEKIWYTFQCNNMKFKRGVELILSARRSQTTLETAIHSPIPKDSIEKAVIQRELFERGIALCGEKEFKMVFDNTCLGLSYSEVAEKYKMKKTQVTDIIKKSLRVLQEDEVFIQYYKELT